MTARNGRLAIIIAVLLVAAIVGLAAAILLRATAHAAPTDTCDPATTAQCCACEPSEAAEPAPLPRLYLPSVQRDMPPMSAEFTPAQPVVPPEPDVELPLGDASQ